MSENEEFSDVIVDLDVGNLCVTRIEELKSSLEKDFNESKIKRIASAGIQKLLNKILTLPSEYHEHIPVAKLPEPTTVIPREKHVPKPKPETKWEKFAKAKGIQKKTKDKLIWDETSKDWKPQYGYRSAKNQTDWMMEVPENSDPYVDLYGVKKEAKTERVAKNEYQRLRNIATAQKMKVTNLESVDRADKDQLSRSMAAAKSATASLGRFQQKLPKEKQPKNLNKKRTFKSNLAIKQEKENNLKILEELNRKKPKLDVAEAVQRHMAKPIKEKSEEKSSASAKKKKAKQNRLKKNTFRSAYKKGFKKPAN